MTEENIYICDECKKETITKICENQKCVYFGLELEVRKNPLLAYQMVQATGTFQAEVIHSIEIGITATQRYPQADHEYCKGLIMGLNIALRLLKFEPIESILRELAGMTSKN